MRMLRDNTVLGLKSLSAMMDEEEITIENAVEPFLLNQSLLKYTPKGRELTEQGLALLTELQNE